MYRRWKQWFSGLILACLLIAGIPGQVMTTYAASGTIAFSDPSVMEGNEVNVTMKITGDAVMSKADIMLSYNADLLEFVSGSNAEGGAGSIRVSGISGGDGKTSSYTLKFKSLKAGKAQITVSTQEIYDADSQMVTITKEGTSTVTITSAANASTNASLTSLNISPGTLTPEFSADVDSYTASVGNSVSKIAVSAGTSDANASVVISGNEGLQSGENTVTCLVTAEDGTTTRTYSIVVTKEEGGETLGEGASGLSVTIDGKVYTIQQNVDESALPEGFESSSYTYQGQEVMAGKGLEKNLTLLYLTDAEGNSGYYIYNEASESWSPYAEISTTGKAVVVLPLDSDAAVPEGFKESTIELDGKQVHGWTWAGETEPQYCVVYGMNWNGEKGFYRYDISEKTIQRYFKDPALDTMISQEQYVSVATDYNDLLHDFQIRGWILVGLLAAVVVLVILLIVVLASRGKNKGSKDEFHMTENRPAEPKQNKKLTKEERYMRGEEEEFEEELMEADEQADSAEPDQEAEGQIDLTDTDDSVEDDFEVLDLDEDEETLEDVEKALARKLAQNAETKTQDPAHEDEDDDFEIIDL